MNIMAELKFRFKEVKYRKQYDVRTHTYTYTRRAGGGGMYMLYAF